MTAVGQVAVSERGFGVGGRSAVERLKRRPAVLEFAAGVAARGLVVGMAEHVGDEREVAAVLADQSRGERVGVRARSPRRLARHCRGPYPVGAVTLWRCAPASSAAAGFPAAELDYRRADGAGVVRESPEALSPSWVGAGWTANAGGGATEDTCNDAIDGYGSATGEG